MRRITLHINRDIRYPFYQAIPGTNEEEFLDEEYRIVWEEAEEVGLSFTIEDRVEIFKGMDSVMHIYWNQVDYFFCDDPDEYWEELSRILDKKGFQ